MPALLLALAGLLVGELLRRRLVTGGYRLDDDLGAPPRALGPVVPVLVAASWWLVAARVAEPAGWVAVPAYLLLVVVGVGCAWVDLDVHRIPDGLLRPGGVLVAALLVVATVATGHWTRLATAAVAGVAAYLAFFLLALPAWGGPAYGDVKLAAVLSAALGWLSPWLALLGVVAGFVVSGVVVTALLLARRVGLRTAVAFGPGLVAGAVLALGLYGSSIPASIS